MVLAISTSRLLSLWVLPTFYISVGNAAIMKRSSFRGAHDEHNPTPHEMQSLYALDALYKGNVRNASETEAQADHAQRDVYNKSGDAAESVYGEIQPEAVLEMFRVTGVREGQKYYDLGSGYGKTVVLAWLEGLNATGVELAGNRWKASCDALQRAPETGISGSGNGVNFVHASFFDVDFSDADLVFMDSVMFSDETMKDLAAAIRHLRPGTKIVSSHMGLPGPGFEYLGELKGAVSWTHRKSRWTIQAVAPGASSLANAVHRPRTHPSSEVCTL